MKPESVVKPEPVVKSEPAVEPEPVLEPKPVVEPELVVELGLAKLTYDFEVSLAFVRLFLPMISWFSSLNILPL